jgi:hypothetical protein
MEVVSVQASRDVLGGGRCRGRGCGAAGRRRRGGHLGVRQACDKCESGESSARNVQASCLVDWVLIRSSLSERETDCAKQGGPSHHNLRLSSHCGSAASHAFVCLGADVHAHDGFSGQRAVSDIFLEWTIRLLLIVPGCLERNGASLNVSLTSDKGVPVFFFSTFSPELDLLHICSLNWFVPYVCHSDG